MSSTDDKQEFLIFVERDYCVADIAVGLRGSLEVRGTRVLSEAKHYPSFIVADRQCQILKRRGYPYAMVSTVDACPVTPAVLRGEAYVPDDLPRNAKELDQMPTAEVKRRMKNDAVFAGRVHEIWNLQEQTR
jgi:hypothetical protein